MKRTVCLTLAAVLMSGGLLLAGCFPEDISGPYDGAPQVSFRDTSATVVDGGGPLTTRVQLIHPDGFLDEATVIRYTADGEERTTTLDPEGFQVSVDGQEDAPEGQFTFPSGSTRVLLTISFSDTQIPAGESRRLVLELIGNEEEGVAPAENYDTYTVTVLGE